MNIQWYPGHMLETKKLLKNSISKVDAILEVLDARLPIASENPILNQLCKDKIRIKVLNKSDLADPAVTDSWLAYFEHQRNVPAISICASQQIQVEKALDSCISRITRNRARKVKVIVVGIPNTGKSTILNTLVGKKVAKTGNVPAITRQQQRTSLKNNIDIYDTPGILWPVIEPQERAFTLAASGAISDTALDYHQIGIFVAGLLLKNYPHLLLERYAFLKQIPRDESELIEKIGTARGCLLKGGNINYNKAAEILIRDLRSGKIGKISFEMPKDIESENEII